MEQKRTNIDKYHEEAKFNKNAFNDVLGDPFAINLSTKKKEPIMGNYARLQRRSSIQAMKNDFDIGRASRTPGQPNIQDFTCDVERIIKLAFQGKPKTLQMFLETYIYETEENLFTPKQRMLLEQKVGKLFRKYKLSPVSQYFTTIRGLGRKV